MKEVPFGDRMVGEVFEVNTGGAIWLAGRKESTHEFAKEGGGTIQVSYWQKTRPTNKSVKAGKELLSDMTGFQQELARRVREAASDVYNVRTWLESGSELDVVKMVELLQRAEAVLGSISR